MNSLKITLVIALTSIFSFGALAQVEGDNLIGVWEPSHGKAKVKIEKIGNKY